MSYAYAVVHGDPPQVYAADDIDTLHRVVAVKVVATTPGRAISPGQRKKIQDALLEERWGDAVVEWMDVMDTIVDVYDSGLELWTADQFQPDVVGLELRFSPLFESG